MFDNDKVKGYMDEVDGDCGPFENGDNGYDNEGAFAVNDKTERCQPCAINEETNFLLSSKLF